MTEACPEEPLEYRDVEALIALERSLLVERDTRYQLVALPLQAYSFASENGRRMTSLYYFARHVDDVLDGDRDLPLGQAADEYAAQIVASMEEPRAEEPEIMRLFHYGVVGDHEDQNRRDMTELIDAILFDFNRARAASDGQPVVLSRASIDEYYETTFIPPFSIALRAGNSQLTDSQLLHDFAQTMGHLYSLRDLEEDLSRGIINIPAEILKQADIDPTALDYETAVRNPIVRSWIHDELHLYDERVRELLADPRAKQDLYTRALTRLFGAGLKRASPTVLSQLSRVS